MAGSIAITMKPRAASAASSSRSTTPSACTRPWAIDHRPSSRRRIEPPWGGAWATLRERAASRRPRPITGLTRNLIGMTNDQPSVRGFAVPPTGCSPDRMEGISAISASAAPIGAWRGPRQGDDRNTDSFSSKFSARSFRQFPPVSASPSGANRPPADAPKRPIIVGQSGAPDGGRGFPVFPVFPTDLFGRFRQRRVADSAGIPSRASTARPP